MEQFLNGIRQKTNVKKTENMANTHKTSNSDLLDLFAMGGSLRTRSPRSIQSLFDRAFCEDVELATKMAFYLRDIRGGLGERRTFRIILHHLAHRDASIVIKNLEHVPFYGRWDDLYTLFDTPLESEAAELMYKQLQKDIDADQPSLLAKWLKSENASSSETKRLAKKTIEYFGMTPREYRKTLSALRERIGVVEKLMSENRWDEINFEGVPSKAAMIYKDAFKAQCPIRYSAYLDKLKSGNASINANTLFPYEIIRQVDQNDYLSDHEITVLDEQWKALPRYDCVDEGAIAVVDTSGSMFMGDSTAAYIALSLGIYFAEHNTGPFANKFITFSRKPELIDVVGNTIADKMYNMKKADWDMNTDIEAVFNLILDVADSYNLTQEEIPSKLIIISDMEFDQARNNHDDTKTLIQHIKDRYRIRGYEMPFLVFWNAEARQNQVPISLDDSGFQLVSGASQSIFKAIVDNNAINAVQLMINTITDERYDKIKA